MLALDSRWSGETHCLTAADSDGRTETTNPRCHHGGD